MSELPGYIVEEGIRSLGYIGTLNWIYHVRSAHPAWEGGGSHWRKWKVVFTFCCSVTRSCPTLCSLMDCSVPDFPSLNHLPELAQTYVHWVSDAVQPSWPLPSPSLPAFNLSQHQSLFQWVSSSHQVAKVLELQLQHQSFQWIFRIDFL